MTASNTLAALRRRVHRQLETLGQEKVGLSFTNWVIVFLILASLVLYTAETEREIELAHHSGFWAFNLAILVIFAAEFVLRLATAGAETRYRGAGGLWAYMRRNWFILAVDFLAFAPELLFVALGVPPPSWLRSLRVFRLFKMARYFAAFRLVADALRACVQELLVALTMATMLWYVSSVLLYLAEHSAQPEGFGSITRAMWWSVVTLTTVGYGDVYPVTIAGRIAAGLIAVIGLGAVALPSGIIAGSFMERVREQREVRPRHQRSDERHIA